MVEFLRKFENRAIKSGRDNSILITQIYQFTVIYFNFVLCRGSVLMLISFSHPLYIANAQIRPHLVIGGLGSVHS